MGCTKCRGVPGFNLAKPCKNSPAHKYWFQLTVQMNALLHAHEDKTSSEASRPTLKSVALSLNKDD